MPAFAIAKFSGEMPRFNTQILPPEFARLALDVDLENGSLRPWRERLPVHTSDAPVRGFIRTGCCWLTSDKCAEFSLLWPSCDFVTRTGVQPYPEFATFVEACADDWARLGVPCPSVAPSASPTAPPNPDPALRSLEMRAYRYSWVNRYNQEGGGSPPSLAYTTNDGTPSIVQIPPCDADPAFKVVAINIYRLATPLESGGETSNPQNTEYYFVAQVPCGTTVFTDSLSMLDLSGGDSAQLAVFTREESIPPPDDLTNIVCLENGMLAGISGEFVMQSEPFAPHSWPMKYWRRLWDTPVALAAVGSTLYVGTTGTPYTIDGRNQPGGDGLTSVYRHREPLPCVSKPSMVAGSGAAYFASNDGLVAISGSDSRVISEQLFSKTDWQQLHPNRMRGALLDGYYFGITDIQGIRLKTPDREHTDDARIAFTRVSDRPVALWRSPEGWLYMAEGNVISQWNAGASPRPYRWRSVPEHFNRETSINAAIAEFGLPGNVEVTHYSDKGDFTRRVWGDQHELPYRLPSWFSTTEMVIEFYGTGEMKKWTSGTSVKEARRISA